jgi:rare lipoprotein A
LVVSVIWNLKVWLLAVFGGVVAVAVLLAVQGGEEETPVRQVAEVRHAATPDVPDAPDEPEASRDDAGDTMVASYYGRALEGLPTASGEPFDADAYTAAHKSLPLGTELEVSRGGESVRVTVNDRGPYTPGRDIDLSLAAAQEIGLTGPGVGRVDTVVV